MTNIIVIVKIPVVKMPEAALAADVQVPNRDRTRSATDHQPDQPYLRLELPHGPTPRRWRASGPWHLDSTLRRSRPTTLGHESTHPVIRPTKFRRRCLHLLLRRRSGDRNRIDDAGPPFSSPMAQQVVAVEHATPARLCPGRALPAPGLALSTSLARCAQPHRPFEVTDGEAHCGRGAGQAGNLRHVPDQFGGGRLPGNRVHRGGVDLLADGSDFKARCSLIAGDRLAVETRPEGLVDAAVVDHQYVAATVVGDRGITAGGARAPTRRCPRPDPWSSSCRRRRGRARSGWL